MSSRERFALLAVGLLCAAISACSDGASSNRHPARGVVREVLLAEHQVVIEHEEIEGLMPAMTMSFDVPDHGLLARLAAGQAIDFTVEATGETFRVVEASVKSEGG